MGILKRTTGFEGEEEAEKEEEAQIRKAWDPFESHAVDCYVRRNVTKRISGCIRDDHGRRRNHHHRRRCGDDLHGGAPH